MQGSIAGVVALVCHTNALLRGRPVPPILPGNSTCRFCESVRFVERKSGLLRRTREVPYAEDPQRWMERVRETGARRARISCQVTDASGRRDFQTTGYVGGGSHWWILVDRADGRTDGWLSRWEVGNREATDQRIWRVTYGMLGEVRNAGDWPDLPTSRAALEVALEAILDFSLKHVGGSFSENFAHALAAIRSGERHGYHQDLAPEGALSKPAADLLDACQSAWVFGGMGSWSDMSPDDPPGVYDRVAAELYRCLCDAIVAATNDSVADRR